VLKRKLASVGATDTDAGRVPFLQILAAVALLMLTFHAQANSVNNIDLREVNVSNSTEVGNITLTELFMTQQEDQNARFWVRVTVTQRTTGRETVSIKYFPSSRFDSVKKTVQRIKGLRKKLVYDRVNNCESTTRSLRFKTKTQVVVDLCSFSAGNLQKVSITTVRAIEKLQVLRAETVNLPDTLYIVSGN